MSRVLRPKTILKISKSSEELFNIDFASVDFDFKGFKTYSEKKCPYVQKSPKTSISPRVLRNFLFTWMKKNNVDDILIQPYSGHKYVDSLEKYNKLVSFSEAKEEYEKVIRKFPV